MQKVFASEERFAGSTDAETVRNALNALPEEGGTCVIPRWNPRTGKAEWRFEKPIILRSNVTLLADNAVLVQERGVFTHLMTAEEGAQNVAVIGEGNALLSGGETSRLKPTTANRYGLPDIECNAMCAFRGVKGLTVRNLEIESPRWAAFLLDEVENASLTDLRFHSYPMVPEEYGILLRGGCRNVVIERLSGRTGASTVELAAENGSEISDVRIRTVQTDPARAALVTIRTGNGGKVHDVDIDGLMDASRFYEKARSGSVLAFGQLRKVPSISSCGSTANNPLEFERKKEILNDDVSRISAKNLYSRAVNAVELLQPFSGTKVTNLMTFGDNIMAIGTRSTQPYELKDVVFDHVYYGAGSEPNNASSFISRAAKGAKAVSTRNVTGYTVSHLYTQEEEG